MSDSFKQLRSVPVAAVSSAASAVPAPPRRLLARVVLPGALLLALILVLGWSGRSLWQTTLAVRVEPVLVRSGISALPVAKDAPGQGAGATHGEAVAKAAGWLEPDPYAVYAQALATGAVEEILVLEGQRVAANQPLAELVKADAQIALSAAAAKVPAQEALLQAAQNELERAVAVSAAQADQAMASQAQWPFEIEAMAAEVTALQDRLTRLERAAKNSGAVVEAELVQQRLAVVAKEKALAVLQAAGPLRKAQVAQAKAEAVAAKRLLEIGTHAAQGELALAKAGLAQAQLRLERMTVRAPVAGVVMNLLKAPGDMLDVNMAMPRAMQVCALYDPGKMQMRVDVPLSLAAKVRVGQAVAVVAEVLPGRTFTGRVTRFVHEADIQKNTVQVKVEIDDPAPELKPEMLATAQFFAMAAPGGGGLQAAVGAAGVQQVFIKPAWLTMRHGAHAMAWVARPAHGGGAIAAEVDLQLGAMSADGFIQVEKGLSPGDRVVLPPWDQLKGGARLRLPD